MNFLMRLRGDRESRRECEEFLSRPGIRVVRTSLGIFHIPESPLAEDIARDPAGLVEAAEKSSVIKGAPGSSLVAEMSFGGVGLILKHFVYRDLPLHHRMKYLEAPARSHHAMLGAALVDAAGIATPRVFAAGVRKTGPLISDSWLLEEEFPSGARTLAMIAEDGGGDPVEHLVRAASMVRRLHGAGLTHGDLNAWNVYFDGAVTGLIDLDDIRVHRGGVPRRIAMKDLGCLVASWLSALDAAEDEERARTVLGAASHVKSAAASYGIAPAVLVEEMRTRSLRNRRFRHKVSVQDSAG